MSHPHPLGLSTEAIDNLASALNLESDLAQTALPVVLAQLQVLDRKQRDYGPHNLTKFGTFGVIVRLNDKVERATTLVQRADGPAVKAETLSDTLLDASNYGLIGFLMSEKLWPSRLP